MTKPSPEALQTLNKIKIVDCGEQMVDVRSYAPLLVVREEISVLVRKTVAEKLAKVTEKLQSGPYQLKFHYGYRPLSWQKEKWDAYYQDLVGKYPTATPAILRREANKMLAPYDQPTPPGHSTGGAVDVYFVDQNGEALDVIPAPGTLHVAATNNRRIPAAAQQLRTYLFDLMTAEGFSNYPREYWHYSYGDSAWAARNGYKECIYGAVPEAS